MEKVNSFMSFLVAGMGLPLMVIPGNRKAPQQLIRIRLLSIRP